MSASTSPRLVADGTRQSPFGSGSATTGSGDQSGQRERVDAGPMVWSLIVLLTIAGSVGIYPELSKLWEIWTTDPLRSIGMIILPTSLFLILRVWRQSGWELHGSWWGLVPVALTFAPIIFARHLEFFWAIGGVKVNFIPNVLPIYLYVGGVILLFAGGRVWRSAWFPLTLLLCAQPVPEALVHFLDLPMQGLSAHIARSFAYLLGFPPTTPELLRLMFTPDFGMFIAPGCDGMRGAITLGYGALISGYLKRLSLLRWSLYVAAAILLGHLFNLIRLCALVLYYRIAVGHAVLEQAAKNADYAIGGVLFLVAASLFVWIVFRKERDAGATIVCGSFGETSRARDRELTSWRAAALALLVLVVSVPAVSGMRRSPENLVSALRRGEISRENLNGRIPTQVGAYRLVRVWQEQLAGAPVLETAAFEKAQSGEIEVGIWLPPSDHSIRQSLMIHGEMPKVREIKRFNTAAGQAVQFDTALYDDGVTYTLIGDTYCNPFWCQASLGTEEGLHLGITKTVDHNTRGNRVVPIFFKIQVPRTDSANKAAYDAMSIECQDFLSHLDLTQVSQEFQ
jgi:exosortase J